MKKNILIFLFVSFTASGCWLKPLEKPQHFPPAVSKETVKQVESKAVSEMAQSVNMAVKEMKGYFVKNDVKLGDGINFFILFSESSFDKILSASAIETNISPKPDFKNKIVVVLSSNRATEQGYDIKIVRAYAIGSDIYVEYDVSQETNELYYYALNAKIFEIEKPQIAMNICFIDAERNTKVFPLGNRSRYSPSNIDDLIKYYTGTYKGTLPSASGPGISTVLVLSKDYTFNLKQIYLKEPDRIYETSGKWETTSDLSSVVLIYDNPGEEYTSFRFLDRATIEKLDIHGEIIESEYDYYKLKK
ncbi:MAG: copper resistance protein NlpE [Endomicrobium sp.]|nr:copper resistance protein NlpE [Endomicrobium sp.]